MSQTKPQNYRARISTAGQNRTKLLQYFELYGLNSPNKGAKIILHAKSPTFRAAKLKGLTVYNFLLVKNTNLHRGSQDSELSRHIGQIIAFYRSVSIQLRHSG